MTMLRLISFGIDRYWATKASLPEDTSQMKTTDATKVNTIRGEPTVHNLYLG